MTELATTEKARRTQQRRQEVHDRPWARMTKVRARQGNSVAIENSLSR